MFSRLKNFLHPAPPSAPLSPYPSAPVAVTGPGPVQWSTGRVLKSYDAPMFPTLFSMPGADNLILPEGGGWEGFYSLYRHGPMHARCCNVKAAAGFGRGLMGDMPGANAEQKQIAAKLSAVTQNGSAALLRQLALDFEVYGNAYLEIVRDGAGRVLRVHWLPARTLYRHADETSFVQVRYTPRGEIRATQFSAEEIIHVRQACPSGGYYAQPQWIAADGMVELVYAATRWNQRFFSNNALPQYAIISYGDAPLPDDQQGMLEQFFRNEFSGLDNAHKSLYLHQFGGDEKGRGIEFKQLTDSRKDGDFINMLGAARDTIIAAHGVPPRMLGVMAAGQLGGGGEVIGQFHVFEQLTLEPNRIQIRDELRPLWNALGIDPAAVQFAPVDVTPPPEETPAATDNTEQLLKALLG